MPQRITIPFVGQQAKDRSTAVDNQETLNFITSIKGEGAKAPRVLESAPGLVDLGTAGNGPLRSPKLVQWIHPTDKTKDTYGVWGTQLIRLTVAQGALVIGTLEVSSNRCRIARGRTHIMVVDGRFGYTYDGTTFAKIADADFPDEDNVDPGSPTHVIYQDSFFIVIDAFTDNFYISAVEDPDSWNALDFEAASVAPDNALAIASAGSIVYICGDETTQLYYNSGNADFPYAIILNATQEVGIAAPQSIAESDDGVFFLATTPEGGLFVYQILGQEGRVISQDAQEFQLSQIANPGAAYGYIYKQAGKSFYILQFDDTQPSLVYNIRSQAWETRALVDGSAYRIAGAGVFNNQSIGGSRLSARYYRFDLGVFSDAGQAFIRRRVTQIYHLNNQLMDWWELVIDIESGVGNQTGAGSDPTIRLRFSDDGGETWSAKLIEPLGKVGERGRRAVYRNLGQSRNRIYEIEVSDPVNVTIVNAYAYVEVIDD